MLSLDTPKEMKLLPVSLPIGSGHTIQILSGHHDSDSVGLWIILASDSSRKLVYCTPSSSESYFVLPYDFVYLGSSSDGKLYFMIEGDGTSHSFLYALNYHSDSGIIATKIDADFEKDNWADLLAICQADDHNSTDPTLHDSPLLHDNALSALSFPSVCVPYHSLRDVIRIRDLLSSRDYEFTANPTTLTAIKATQAVYPNLTVVDALEIDDNHVAIIANDSYIRTLSCGVESRLFVTNGSSTPCLVLGRSIFSINNTLSMTTESSSLIFPSLGLVLVPACSAFPSTTAGNTSSLCAYNITYTTSSLYCSTSNGSTFTFAGSIVHRDSDLVPLLIHHLDYSQTLILSSRLDTSEVYFLDNS